MKQQDYKFYDDHKEDLFKQEKITLYLKKLRVGMKKTQEEVCVGICTVSYYSRIENNQLIANEELFMRLFKRLDMDYYLLRETIDRHIFNEIIACYLERDNYKAEQLINEALKNYVYCEMEYDLMMLYDNIVKEYYADAYKLILDLRGKVECLDEEERVYFYFMNALFAYRTNKGVLAYNQIVQLQNIELNNNYRLAVNDLALDIYTYTGSVGMFIKTYKLLDQEKFFSKYPERGLVHEAEREYLLYSLSRGATLNELNVYLNNAHDTNKDIISDIMFEHLYRFRKYEACLELINGKKITPKLIAYKAILLLEINNSNLLMNVIDERSMLKNNEFDKCYIDLIDIIIIMKTSKDFIVALERTIDLVNYEYSVTNNDFFKRIVIELMVNLAVKCGRYKDTVKMLSLSLVKENENTYHYI